MTPTLRPAAIAVGAAIALGITSAYADEWIGAYWRTDSPPWFATVAFAVVVLVSNAAGFWALCGVAASVAVTRRLDPGPWRAWAGVLAATGFLGVAVVSYYGTIAAAQLRPGGALLPALGEWLVAALVAGIPTGVAGAWLATTTARWRRLVAAAVVVVLVAFDLRHLAGVVPQVAVTVAVSAAYVAVVVTLVAWAWRRSATTR